MKVRELIEKLRAFDPESEMFGTWEGTVRDDIGLYQAADGRTVLDLDNNEYKLKWQKTPCVVCGEQASGKPDGQPMCYKHWRELEEKFDAILKGEVQS